MKTNIDKNKAVADYAREKYGIDLMVHITNELINDLKSSKSTATKKEKKEIDKEIKKEKDFLFHLTHSN